MNSFFTLSLLLCSFLASFPCKAVMFENYSSLSFDEGYTQLFGDSNLMQYRDGKTVHISLDERSGSGFASQDLYLHGFFSASIKLPSDYAAGVVVAFYMSNGDIYERTHDELDFEFLGNIRGREWRIQTNIYGNGSTEVGREERYSLWFDPTEEFHHYSFLWSHERIIFYIDNIPIREMAKTVATGGAFPTKPMSLYATIWDGSKWATLGGRYKANYKYAPFIAQFSDLVLHGCSVDPTNHLSTCDVHESDIYDRTRISNDQRTMMEKIRAKHMTYSYCYDRERYPTPLPECNVDFGESRKSYRSSGERFVNYRRHRKGYQRRSRRARVFV